MAYPLEVRPAPYTVPQKDEIVVRNHAISINPLDWIKQVVGNMMFSWIKYPAIIGCDVAGEVVAVGQGVTRFKVGDRVVGHAVGTDTRSNKSSEGAFQRYTVLRTNLASPIPDSLSYESACVLPLCLSTAACGLYMKDYLALPHPTTSPKPTGKTLLIWGGSTSVGSNAIQLAIASGFEVITTASPKNFGYVKRLGAVEAFDYSSPTVVSDIIEAFRDRESGGAFAIGKGSLGACIEILGAVKGTKFITAASADIDIGNLPQGMIGMVGVGMSLMWITTRLMIKARVKSVSSKFVFGSDLMANEVGKAIYEDFLPVALAEGKFVAAPEPQIVGKGLKYVQEAMDLNKKGLSAKKAVVSL
ncbi:hypothetical protein MBLNU459_g2344t1 [Dothideomycetes sp. NU459]